MSRCEYRVIENRKGSYLSRTLFRELLRGIASSYKKKDSLKYQKNGKLKIEVDAELKLFEKMKNLFRIKRKEIRFCGGEYNPDNETKNFLFYKIGDDDFLLTITKDKSNGNYNIEFVLDEKELNGLPPYKMVYLLLDENGLELKK